jgi:hypothetical protein
MHHAAVNRAAYDAEGGAMEKLVMMFMLAALGAAGPSWADRAQKPPSPRWTPRAPVYVVPYSYGYYRPYYGPNFGYAPAYGGYWRSPYGYGYPAGVGPVQPYWVPDVPPRVYNPEQGPGYPYRYGGEAGGGAFRFDADGYVVPSW